MAAGIGSDREERAISRVFFESPLWLGVFCFVAAGAVLFARQRMEREAWRRRSLWCLLIGIPLLFVVQSLVVTQQERILARLDLLVAAIEEEDAAAARAIFSRSYQCDGVDYEGFSRQLDGWLEWLDIRDTRLRRRNVEVDGDAATMRLTASATVRVGGEAGAEHIGTWRIEWVREGTAWSIVAVRPEMIDFREISSMNELRR